MFGMLATLSLLLFLLFLGTHCSHAPTELTLGSLHGDNEQGSPSPPSASQPIAAHNIPVKAHTLQWTAAHGVHGQYCIIRCKLGYFSESRAGVDLGSRQLSCTVLCSSLFPDATSILTRREDDWLGEGVRTCEACCSMVQNSCSFARRIGSLAGAEVRLGTCICQCQAEVTSIVSASFSPTGSIGPWLFDSSMTSPSWHECLSQIWRSKPVGTEVCLPTACSDCSTRRQHALLDQQLTACKPHLPGTALDDEVSVISSQLHPQHLNANNDDHHLTAGADSTLDTVSSLDSLPEKPSGAPIRKSSGSSTSNSQTSYIGTPRTSYYDQGTSSSKLLADPMWPAVCVVCVLMAVAMWMHSCRGRAAVGSGGGCVTNSGTTLSSSPPSADHALDSRVGVPALADVCATKQRKGSATWCLDSAEVLSSDVLVSCASGFATLEGRQACTLADPAVPQQAPCAHALQPCCPTSSDQVEQSSSVLHCTAACQDTERGVEKCLQHPLDTVTVPSGGLSAARQVDVGMSLLAYPGHQRGSESSIALVHGWRVTSAPAHSPHASDNQHRQRHRSGSGMCMAAGILSSGSSWDVRWTPAEGWLDLVAGSSETLDQDIGTVSHLFTTSALYQQFSGSFDSFDQPPRDVDGLEFGQRPPQEEVEQLVRRVSEELHEEELHVSDILGAGAYGVVYLGRWRDMQVAVKTLLFRDRRYGDHAGRQRCLNEAAICATLDHPNIVSTYTHSIKAISINTGRVLPSAEPQAVGSGQELVTDWKMYIIQEYCCFGSLRAVIDEPQPPLSWTCNQRWQATLPLALQVAMGLAYCHSQNIIHTDINPNNVLLTKGEGHSAMSAKLADFGLSVRLPPGSSRICNVFHGTPFYAAPEVQQFGMMTPAADVYSFGVVLWELVHGPPPWRASPSCRQAALRAIRQHPETPNLRCAHLLLEVSPGCPPDICALITACLMPHPRHRPSSSQLVTALSHIVQQLTQQSSSLAHKSYDSAPESSADDGCAQASGDQSLPVTCNPLVGSLALSPNGTVEHEGAGVRGEGLQAHDGGSVCSGLDRMSEPSAVIGDVAQAATCAAGPADCPDSGGAGLPPDLDSAFTPAVVALGEQQAHPAAQRAQPAAASRTTGWHT